MKIFKLGKSVLLTATQTVAIAMLCSFSSSEENAPETDWLDMVQRTGNQSITIEFSHNPDLCGTAYFEVIRPKPKGSKLIKSRTAIPGGISNFQILNASDGDLIKAYTLDGCIETFEVELGR